MTFLFRIVYLYEGRPWSSVRIRIIDMIKTKCSVIKDVKEKFFLGSQGR